MKPLSVRERQVLALVAEGLTTKAIALRLGLAYTTTRNYLYGNGKGYLAGIFPKLGVTCRVQAARWWIEHMEAA